LKFTSTIADAFSREELVSDSLKSAGVRQPGAMVGKPDQRGLATAENVGNRAVRR